MSEDGCEAPPALDAAPALDEASSRTVRAPTSHLSAQLSKLTRLIDSGEVASSLRRVMMLNPVRHGERYLSALEANVVETLARFPRPVPLTRLGPRQVAWLQPLQRAGFVVVDGRVRVTPRGRALGVARARERAASLVELGCVRDALACGVRA